MRPQHRDATATETSVEAPLLLTYKFRLNPEKRQHRALERISEQQRLLYNAALEERIDAYRKTGRAPTEVEQSRSLTVIRGDDPAFAAVQRRIQRATLRRLDRAYKAFFKRARAGAGAASGFPRFKGKAHWHGFAFDAFAQITFERGGLLFSGMQGILKVHVDRPLPSTDIKGVHFKREGRRWYVGFQIAVPRRATRAGCGHAAVGADWGTSVLLHLSTGEVIANARPGEQMEKEVRRAQRAVARKIKGSRGRAKARDALGRVTARVAHRRADRMHKVAQRLVTHFGLVAVEDIAAKGLMDAERPGETLPEFVKRRRNREALDAAPYKLRQMLAYKADRERGRLIVVQARHTTQECFWCGRMHFKELTDAEHVCRTPGPFEGLRAPRKLNAARVILKRALNNRNSSPVDDDRGGPVPGGLSGGDAVVRNASNGSRRLGNTEGGQLPPERRPARPGPPTSHS